MRPKTLTGAAIPVMLAGALAWHESVFLPAPWLCCLAFACLMQVAANFINDLYDHLKGSDRDDRLGPERACAQGWITSSAMRRGIVCVTALACVFGFAALLPVRHALPWGGWEYVVLGLTCVLFAFLYTVCLSYWGLGDVLVVVFFGLVPVGGTWFLMQQTMPLDVVLLGFISGISIDALLVVNNFRDRKQDALSGKRTLVVRLGERFGSLHYVGIGVLTSVLVALLGVWYLPAAAVYLWLHLRAWREMVRIHEGKALNAILGQTSRNMFVLAVLLSLTLMFA